MPGLTIKPRHPYFLRHLYFHTLFESLDGYKQVVVGSGSISIDTAGVYPETGVTINSVAELSKAPDYPLATPTWDKKRRFKTKFYVDSITNQLVHIGIGYFVPGAIPGLAFRIVDDDLYGLVNDATGTSTVLLQTIAAATGYSIEGLYLPGVRAKFYVNRVLKGELTTNLPSGDTYAELILGIIVQNTAAEDKLVGISEWKFLQSP